MYVSLSCASKVISYTEILIIFLHFVTIVQLVDVPPAIPGTQEFQVDHVKNVSVILTDRCLFLVILSLDSACASLDPQGGSVQDVNLGMLVKASHVFVCILILFPEFVIFCFAFQK